MIETPLNSFRKFIKDEVLLQIDLEKEVLAKFDKAVYETFTQIQQLPFPNKTACYCELCRGYRAAIEDVLKTLRWEKQYWDDED